MLLNVLFDIKRNIKLDVSLMFSADAPIPYFENTLRSRIQTYAVSTK